MTLAEVGSALGVQSPAIDEEITRVSTDTRTLKPGDLFVALRGEWFDGHDYLFRAFEDGAVAAIVEQAPAGLEDKCLIVPDTLRAYGKIAHLRRSRLEIPVVAVTGSVGKTTTKEMIALMLSPLGEVLKSAKNENNEVGVPQTLLRLNERCRAAVIEMGMRGRGQIADLAEIAAPTVGVITLIGESHIELLGSREAIADAKGELLEALPADAVAVINADDEFADYLGAKTKARRVTFGLSENAQFRATDLTLTEDGWRFNLHAPGNDPVLVVLRSMARHDAANAAAALAVAVSAGVSPKDACDALSEYRPAEMRMETLRASSGALILSDCYNAAPSSVKSALRTLAEYPGTHRRIAFLGDMKELGDFAPQMHTEVVAAALDSGVDALYAVGAAMASAADGKARRAFTDSVQAAEFAAGELDAGPDDVVLVKGSRSMAMERVTQALTAKS